MASNDLGEKLVSSLELIVSTCIAPIIFDAVLRVTPVSFAAVAVVVEVVVVVVGGGGGADFNLLSWKFGIATFLHFYRIIFKLIKLILY